MNLKKNNERVALKKKKKRNKNEIGKWTKMHILKQNYLKSISERMLNAHAPNEPNDIWNLYIFIEYYIPRVWVW